ncbi:hypothetical protein [Yoonia algicola]|uniref:Uncharacterized protein n=1 Tax=Yoonia algicola TaxID=3137368 RepID=A0AAN0M6P1_9RHOB
MSRLFFALTAAALVATAAPASALSLQVDLPTLTYPLSPHLRSAKGVLT